MRDGRIQQLGTPLEIYNRPKNRFVAGFIGAPAMNFLDVTLEDAGGELYAVAPGFRIRVPAERRGLRNLSGDRAMLLGVRPEHTLLGEPKPEHGTSFDAVVEVTEQLGAELLLGVRAAGRTLIASRIDPEMELHLHAPVRMSLDPRGLHFFDRDSGEALR
jgi:multiple sugar transport system ATP-binding protein